MIIYSKFLSGFLLGKHQALYSSFSRLVPLQMLGAPY
jgi:hypothetical protein